MEVQWLHYTFPHSIPSKPILRGWLRFLLRSGCFWDGGWGWGGGGARAGQSFSAHTPWDAWFYQLTSLTPLTSGEAVAGRRVLRVLIDCFINLPLPPNLLVFSYLFAFCTWERSLLISFQASSSTNGLNHNHSYFSWEFNPSTLSFLCLMSLMSSLLWTFSLNPVYPPSLK